MEDAPQQVVVVLVRIGLPLILNGGNGIGDNPNNL